MAVMRVHKNGNYTIMSNFHFKEKEMSLKAKGLLSLMLSLPEDWDYSINGLATLSKDGRDSVMSALQELEKFGYLTRTRIVNEKGHFKGYDYDIFEEPQFQPKSENPYTEKPNTGEPITENPQQLNTKELNTLKNKELNNKLINNDKANAEPLPSIEPNIFIKELVKCGYIEQDELFMEQFNYFMQEIANQYGFDIARACLMYFVSRNNGYDENGNPILNKFSYFKTSIENGVKRINTPFYGEDLSEGQKKIASGWGLDIGDKEPTDNSGYLLAR